jgi:sugar phosphate isomerase/epimerase
MTNSHKHTKVPGSLIHLQQQCTGKSLPNMSRLGTITYNIAKDWDLDRILKSLEKLGYEGVELRTSHAHKVEVNLSKSEREAIRKRFEDSPVELAGLGSAFEYQNADMFIVRKNIEATKEYVRLAHDVGAPGVKVRPNGIPKGTNLEKTLEQIGKALHEVSEDAEMFGVEIRLEVHGAVTCELPNIAKIMRYADHPNVYVCWNSNPTDVSPDGTIQRNFALVANKIREVHLHDLTDDKYPWRELFRLLKAIKYNGFTLAEIPESSDPERVLTYFKSLWQAYQPLTSSSVK